MANIHDKLNKIISAVFGKDVRQALHDGLDAINKETESTTDRQVVLEETFDQLTINAGNSNAEIVAARVDNNGNSYETVGKRINGIDASLENKANKSEARLKNTNITLNDCDSTMLGAIQGGEGTSFDLLSVPREKSVDLSKLSSDLLSNKYIIEDCIRQWNSVEFYLDATYKDCELKAEFYCTPKASPYVAIQSNNQTTNAIKFTANKKELFIVKTTLNSTGSNRLVLTVIDGMTYDFSGVYENIKIWIDGVLKPITSVVPKVGTCTKVNDNIDFLATQKFVENKVSDIKLNQLNTGMFGNDYRVEMNTGKWISVNFKFDKPFTNGKIRVRGIVKLDRTDTFSMLGNRVTCNAGIDKYIDLSKDITTSTSGVSIGTPDGMDYNYTGNYKDFIITIDDVIVPYTVTPTPVITTYPKPNFAVNKDYVSTELQKQKDMITTEYMSKFNLYPLDSTVINPPGNILNGAIINLEIDGISNDDYKKGLFIRRICNSFSWATVAHLNICCGDTTDEIFSIQLSNYTGEVTMSNICTYVVNATNGHIGKLKITIDFSKLTVGATTYYNKEQTLINKNVIKNIKGVKSELYKLPFVNNLYVVQGTNSNRKQSVPVFIDYLYNGNANKILFENGEDRTYIRESNLSPEAQGKNIINKKEILKFKSDTLNVEPITFNKISIEEKTPNNDIRLLIIGDSVTAGAITNKQYWAVSNELFAKEDIDRKRTSNVMFLGSNNVRKETVDYAGVQKEIKSCACGISSWSLTNWLTDTNSHFVYDDNGTKKFSVLKWLERYRTHDDNGNKLTLGSGTGILITSNNIDNIQCCTPNIVYINSTHNGGTIAQHEQMIDIIRTEIPNCKIIVGAPMPLIGTWHKEKYVGIDWLDGYIEGPNYGWGGNYGNDRINSLNYYVEKEKTTPWFYYMPQVVTMPTVEALEYDLVDCGVKQMKQATKVNQLPKEHPGTLTHKIWGYELYALLKYISGVNNGATNNFDTVPLY